MKLYLNDAIRKPALCYLKDLEVGQIFVDNDGDYCMKITPEEDTLGDILTAVALSGASIGSCLTYEEDAPVIPVEAELNIIKYE